MTSEIEEETSSEEVVEVAEPVETVEPEPEPEPEPSRYLVLDSNNSVVNIIVYDGISEYNPGEGLSLEPNPVDENKNYIFTTIGSVKNEDGTFTHPEPTVVTE